MSNNRKSGNNFALKLFATVTSLLLAASVITTGVCFATNTWQVTPKDDVVQEQPGNETPAEDEGGLVVNQPVNNGISLMSAKIAAADFEEYGISPMAESAQQLTATIEPADATNKKVNWSVAFINPSSTWASGKNVTDYVTVTPTSDGALTANVECKKGFSEQIKVIVTSRESPLIAAECTVDYVKRLTDVNVVMKKNGTPTEEVVFSAEGFNYTWECNPVYSDGTLDDSFTYKYTLSTTSAAVEGVKEIISTPIHKQTINVGWSQNELTLLTSKDNILTILNYDNKLTGSMGEKQKNVIRNAFTQYTGELFSLKIEATGEHSSNTITKTFNAGVSSIDVSVTDIALGQVSIIF